MTEGSADWRLPRPSRNRTAICQCADRSLVEINQLQVGINVRLSFFNRDWFNSIQNKDSAAFWSLLRQIAELLPWHWRPADLARTAA
jgi:vitamin B12/bleomycin/antimicrobial peptide transport system ATP-binding/permease protein